MSEPPPTARPSSLAPSANDTAEGNSPRRAKRREQLAFVRLLARETSYGNAAAYVLSRLTAKALPGVKLTRYFLVAQPIPETLPVLKRPRSSISIEVVPPENYRYDWFPRPKANIDARFAQGAVCLVAFTHGRAIGCIWLQHGPYSEDEVRCLFNPLPVNEAMWDFDVYVDPAYRAGRTFAYLWDAAFEWARREGILWSMSRINAFNLTSVLAHRRLGARIVGTSAFLTAGRLQLSRTPNRPFLHLSLSKGPTVTVSPPM